MLDIPGHESSRTIDLQDQLIKNYEVIIELYKSKEKTYDEVIYMREQKMIFLQGTLDTLLLAREASFGSGAA